MSDPVRERLDTLRARLILSSAVVSFHYHQKETVGDVGYYRVRCTLIDGSELQLIERFRDSASALRPARWQRATKAVFGPRHPPHARVRPRSPRQTPPRTPAAPCPASLKRPVVSLPSSEASTMFLRSAAPSTLPEGGTWVTPATKGRGAYVSSAYSVTSPAICCLSAAARGESDTGFTPLLYVLLERVACREASARPVAARKRLSVIVFTNAGGHWS